MCLVVSSENIGSLETVISSTYFSCWGGGEGPLLEGSASTGAGRQVGFLHLSNAGETVTSTLGGECAHIGSELWLRRQMMGPKLAA